MIILDNNIDLVFQAIRNLKIIFGSFLTFIPCVQYIGKHGSFYYRKMSSILFFHALVGYLFLT